ncbi:MAG: phosphate regulon sensor histidine kinase PhoR, partial [Gammaproteobacteria bacterium]
GAYTLLVARDITALHRLNEMRKDFVANASHELRTPLTVITGYLEALDEDAGARPAGEWHSRIAQMRKQSTRMQRLIEDLLTLSTMENESTAAEGEEIQVAELAAVIQKEAQTLSADAAHIITLEADPSLRLKGIHRDIYSAFSNIVCNAVQYTPPGGRIAIRWHGVENGAELEVEDSGEGIAPEHIPRLTERFYRVDKGRSRARGGTGLGLAIVKHVLARHDATLEIRSEPGKGSTFTCHFPGDRVIRRQDARRLPKSA